MKEIFNFQLYDGTYVDISVTTLLLLVLLIFATKLLLRLYTLFIKKQLSSYDVFDKEKEVLLLKIGRTVIIACAIIAGTFSLGFYDLITHIFSYNLTSFRDQVNITPGKILFVVVIIIIARFLSRLIRILLKKNFSKKAWIDEGKEYTIFKLTKYALYTISIIIAFTSIGLDIKILLGGAAALLVGVGLGLQHIFEDLISGLIILFEGTVKVGDVIEVNGLVAKVQQIDIRTSKVVTRDGNYIIIPNAKLTSENVINWSHGSKLNRFSVHVRVKFGSDTQKVRDILYHCALRHPDVSKNREIIVRFEEFDDYGLIFHLFFWAKKTWVVETLQSEIRFDIDRQFRENNITIPFPQRDLHIIPKDQSHFDQS